MKKRNIFAGLLLSMGLVVAAGTVLVSRQDKAMQAKADAELNDSFDKIYSDDFNNVAGGGSFNYTLLCFTGVTNGYDSDTDFTDAATLNYVKLNGELLSSYAGSKLRTWGGQNWIRVYYPTSAVSDGEGCTLEIASGLTIGNSVIAGVKLVMDSNNKWQFDSYLVDEVETEVLALNPNYWGFVVFQLSGYTGTQAHVLSSSASKCLSNDIYINGDLDSKLLNAGPTWNTLAAPSNANYFGWDPSALSDSLDNISNITIPAGTKFPSTSFVDQSKGDGYRLYVTNKDVTFAKQGSSWIKLTYIKDDELVKNGDYTLFTPSDFNNGSNSSWPFYIQNVTQLSNLNFGLQFNLTLTEEQISGYQTLRLGTTLTGNEYFELLINYKANTYIKSFNGVAGNIPSSVASISVTANEKHLFELYSIKVSENSVRILLGIDGILIFKTDALDATGASCSAIALFSGNVTSADEAYSACETTTAKALGRFYSKKLESPSGSTALEKFENAKKYYETYLTLSQRTVLEENEEFAFIKTAYQTLAEAALSEYKESKKTELSNYASEDDYSEVNWMTVESYISEGCNAIEEADNSEAVDMALASAKSLIDAVPTLMDELDAAKEAAYLEIDGYASSSDYREAEQLLLAQYISECKSLIGNITDPANIAQIRVELDAAEDKIDALTTKAEYEAAELAQAKIDAKVEIENYKSDVVYREAEATQRATIIAECKADIDEITDYEDIDDIEALVATAKADIDELKTDEEYKAELAAHKVNTKAVVDSMVETIINNYRSNEQGLINEAASNVKTNIDNAESVEAVDSLYTGFVTYVGELETDAELNQKEANVVINAINAIPTLTPSNYLNIEEYIISARSQFNALSEGGKALVNNLNVLELLEIRLAELKEEKTHAEAVDALIGQIGEVNAAEASYNKIKVARDAYENLNNEERSMVTKLSELQAKEALFAQALSTIKSSGKDEIDRVYNALDLSRYAEDDKELILDLVSEAKADVDGAKYSEEVASIIESFKTEIGEIPQIAPQPAKSGCGGSITTTSIALSALTLVGIVLIIIRRRKYQ